MATGFDNRGGGRDTFASQGTQPVQTNSGASGESRGSQVQGGESIGGGEGGEFSEAGYVAAGLGAYLEQVMAPHVERKRKEAFFKGFTEAQSGVALQELADTDSPLAKMFGPSGFSEGAQYYTAQSRINEWGQKSLNDIDNLKQMSQADLSTYMSESMEGMMTGDPYADAMIQEGLMQASGPVIQTVAKARFEWGQEVVMEAQETSAFRGASILQQIAGTNAALGEQGDNEAVRAELQRFLGGMAKPEGMTEENYQTFMYNFMRKSMTDGNFYAVEALNQMGVSGVLDDEQQEKLTNMYDRQANRLLDETAAHPDIMQEILKIDAGVEFEKLSVEDAVNGYRAINDKLSQITGVATQYFDDKAIRAAGGRVLGVIASRQRRNEDRQFRRQLIEEERAAEAAATLATATAAWGTGQVTSAESMGMSKATFEQIAMKEYSQGTLGGIARAYAQSGWHSTSVASQIQAKARAGLGDTYTKATDQAYQEWKAMADVNPALASQYFGEYDLAFSNFHRMTQGGIGPEVAFRDAFSKVGGYAIQSVPPASRKAYDETLNSLVSDRSFSWKNPLKWGNYTLTDTSQAEFIRTIGDEFARIKEHSGRPDAQAAQQAMTVAISNGRWEQYGEIGWSNPRPAQNLGQTLGLQPRMATEVVSRAIKYHLGLIGVDDNEGVRVIRAGRNLTLEVLRDDGTTTYSTIGSQKGMTSEAWLKAFATNIMKEERDTNGRRRRNPLREGETAGMVFSL